MFRYLVISGDIDLQRQGQGEHTPRPIDKLLHCKELYWRNVNRTSIHIVEQELTPQCVQIVTVFFGHITLNALDVV